MAHFLARRLLLVIPITLALATLVFFLMKLAPGDPALAFLGDKATPEAVAALNHKWGLDDPLFVQYANFIGQLVTGDLGFSFTYQAPVSQLLADRLPVTLLLILISVLFAVVLSVPLAMWVATSRSALASNVVRIFNAVFQGAPAFFIASLLISFFALGAGLFPIGGFGSTPLEKVHSLVLPEVAVALSLTPVLTRSLITSLGDAFDSEFVGFARSKGLPPRVVNLRYALRNGSISAVSILGISIGHLIGGALVVENVFAVPGVGTLLLQSVTTRDFPVVQGLTIVFGVLVVLVALITDVAYGLLDPRARATGKV